METLPMILEIVRPPNASRSDGRFPRRLIAACADAATVWAIVSCGTQILRLGIDHLSSAVLVGVIPSLPCEQGVLDD